MSLTRDGFLKLADEIINNLSRTVDPHEYIANQLRTAGIHVPESEEAKINRLHHEWHTRPGVYFDTFGEYAAARGMRVSEAGAES